jgi:hypothetical protein
MLATCNKKEPHFIDTILYSKSVSAFASFTKVSILFLSQNPAHFVPNGNNPNPQPTTSSPKRLPILIQLNVEYGVLTCMGTNLGTSGSTRVFCQKTSRHSS